jgi:glycosyltransferase involved in cell wall biosynthesis
MSQNPLVSIIVNNYNYGRFLPEAIDSALNQTYRNVEVIVVDDGSTDTSRQLICIYSNQVISVLKENGGQASAFNAGFAQSQGQIIIFLDADDILKPDIVQRVVEVFQNNSDIAGVQYRLEIIDEKGQPTNTVIPPSYLPLPNRDLRGKVVELLNCSSWSPTSGNAFAASTLRRILPMPEALFRLSADYYLVRANAFCGPLKSLDGAGGYYRSHGTNNYYTSIVNLDQIRQQVSFTRAANTYIKRFAELLGIGYPDEAINVPDEIFLAQRIISCKLEPGLHPIQEDTLLSLCEHGVNAILCRPNLSVPLKFLHLLWFVGMVMAPKSLALLLAKQFFPESRYSLNKMLNLIQWGQKRAILREGRPYV